MFAMDFQNSAVVPGITQDTRARHRFSISAWWNSLRPGLPRSMTWRVAEAPFMSSYVPLKPRTTLNVRITMSKSNSKD